MGVVEKNLEWRLGIRKELAKERTWKRLIKFECHESIPIENGRKTRYQIAPW